ncbi:MAG TPA: glycoside hydrolase 43 family protein [Bacteroidaceae bacterium]|nr:glycoside hydrolase 43 family protein [Bacteroidaceae bacterium]HQL26390.1 glycoside hydrolase 43 family protein [Bacteroidaceae bacterium]
MKTCRLFMVITLAALLTSAVGCTAKNKVTECINPLTYTDVPDPDLIRVGDDYYMISTTMYFCPGAPIMHSKDLVHWEIVSYVYDYLNDDDVYNLRNGRNAYGRGQWAASLRYVDGTYYALFIANDQGKTYVYKTKDINSSFWERSVIDRPFHDASMLFEDGRLFVVWGNGDIRIIELEPDGSAIKAGAEEKIIIESPRQGYNLRAEGAHIYHIGDYYYILVIDWPSGGVRTETCWRSKDLYGPYESKVILSGPFDGRGDGVAQGGIVQTQNGDWYAVMFQDHGAVGRIPTLQPVTWVDDWPILGDDTKPVKQFTVNLPESGENRTWANDEFNYKKEELDLVWQWNHKPDNSAWSVTERKGWLRLKTSHIATGVMDARNTLTQRTVGPRCYSEVLLDAAGMKPGDRAGIIAFQSNYCTIGVEVAEDGSKSLVAMTHRNIGRRRPPQQAQAAQEQPNPDTEFLRMPLTQDKVWLKLRYVFTPQADDTVRPDQAFMSWSLDGKNWTEVDAVLQMSFTLDYFTGYRTGLYNYATTATGGYADFDYFRQEIY